MGALEGLAVEVHRGLESGRVIRAFSDATIRRQVEAAPLRQFLQLVLIHFSNANLSNNPNRKQITSRTENQLRSWKLGAELRRRSRGEDRRGPRVLHRYNASV
nr:hypothetical protein Iba_chr09bCG5010 [Ipomoea batatas]GME12920.1 hypothetical protein Iba_scaffold14242CG0010 [Ipomoea batatas]